MKTVLVVELEDDVNLDDVEIRYAVQDKYGLPEKAEVDGVKLRPLPEQMLWGHTSDFIEGYNACLDEITGETDKEKPDDTADIIRKWERYCDCGAKMRPNRAGGWYCPACHRTMKSILFKRVK